MNQFRIVMMALALAVSAPAYAADADFKELISGKSVPLTLKVKDLKGEWRRMNVTGQSDGGMGALGMLYGAMLSGAAPNEYFTKGDTVSIGGESYLVAYRTPQKPLDMAKLEQLGRHGPGAPQPEPMTEDTVLALALLNLKNIGSLNDIRPFSLKDLAAEGEALVEDKAQTESVNRLKQLGLTLHMYAADQKGMLPDMASAGALKKALAQYITNDEIFAHPGTHEAYVPNPSLSDKKLSDAKNPDKTVLMYESKPGGDEKRGVLFLDGHVERVPESKWPELKKSSGIQ